MSGAPILALMPLLTQKISGCRNKAAIIFTACRLVSPLRLAVPAQLLLPIVILATVSASDSCQAAKLCASVDDGARK